MIETILKIIMCHLIGDYVLSDDIEHIAEELKAGDKEWVI